MKSVIAFRDGRRVNLASAVSPELYAELEGTVSHRKDPSLFCGGCGGGIYVKHGSARRDELFGAHHDAGTCGEVLAIRKSVMSDEHKRMAEYHAAAARAEGLDADLEVATCGRTRVDVVIDGRIGFEVQRSALTARAAVDRTVRSIAAGLETVAWCTPDLAPQWNGRVPGYRFLDNGRHLRELPPPRSVKAIGVWTARAERSWRGGWSPQLEPVTVLLDDAIVRMAAKTIRPVMTDSNVRLMTAEGIALLEELGSTSLAPYGPGSAPFPALPPAPEAACLRPPAARYFGLTGDEPFWCEHCNSQHPLREHRQCRRAARRSG